MTRIAVDRNTCEGHGFCEALAPDVFQVDDDGKSTFHGELAADLAELAVDSCPVGALRIDDQSSRPAR